jgi:hypothetical protein
MQNLLDSLSRTERFARMFGYKLILLLFLCHLGQYSLSQKVADSFPVCLFSRRHDIHNGIHQCHSKLRHDSIVTRDSNAFAGFLLNVRNSSVLLNHSGKAGVALRVGNECVVLAELRLGIS